MEEHVNKSSPYLSFRDTLLYLYVYHSEPNRDTLHTHHVKKRDGVISGQGPVALRVHPNTAAGMS